MKKNNRIKQKKMIMTMMTITSFFVLFGITIAVADNDNKPVESPLFIIRAERATDTSEGIFDTDYIGKSDDDSSLLTKYSSEESPLVTFGPGDTCEGHGLTCDMSPTCDSSTCNGVTCTNMDTCSSYRTCDFFACKPNIPPPPPYNPRKDYNPINWNNHWNTNMCC